MLNVFVRNVNPIAVAKIDRLAKEEGVSRNEFLKVQMENLSVIDEYKAEREKVEQTLNSVAAVLEKSFEKMDRAEKDCDKLFLLISMATDIDLEEMDEFISARKNVIVEMGE